MSEARRVATYEDLLAVPETMTAEIIDGELVTMTRPRPKHGGTQHRIAHFVGGPFDSDEDGPGGWWIVIEPLIEFSPTRMVSPDLAGWRRERLPELPDDPRVRVVPDWVCEVLSPGTVRYDRVRKANIYAEHGVRWMWIADLDNRVVEAYENIDASWRRINAWDATSDAARIPPFNAVALNVNRLFP
jgi:Uma2 family endonuclease